MKIKNKVRYNDLVATGWTTCEVEGQLNPPDQADSMYSAHSLADLHAAGVRVANKQWIFDHCDCEAEEGHDTQCAANLSQEDLADLGAESYLAETYYDAETDSFETV